MGSKKMPDELGYSKGSGNVFVDLELPKPDQRMAKALRARAIDRAIRSAGLTQAAAAELMQCAQPDVSRVVRGDVSGFSM